MAVRSKANTLVSATRTTKMNQVIQEVLDKCGILINEASQMNLHIGRMLEVEASLAGRYAYLIQEAAKAGNDLNIRYWIRKGGFAESEIKARKAGSKSDKDAGNIALLENKKIIDEANQAVFEFELLNNFCKGIDRVLISLTHRIKHLEAEAARSGKVGV